ncbi:MAG: CAP domain-containing protein [Desulfobacteraceae bacterium]|nr:MAG: CAP domain-containing protein [Desulfobacteraceae bacterium]
MSEDLAGGIKFAKIACGLLAVCLLAGAVGCAAGNKRAGQPATDSAAGLFGMPAEKFFELGKAGRPIDPQKLDYTLMAAALFHETNQRRRQAGKPALRHDPRLDEAARTHGRNMAEKKFVSHTNPHSPESRTPLDRVARAGFTPSYIAENVATYFNLRCEEGRMLYSVHEGTAFSYEPDSTPIPEHSYRSFAESLVTRWMNSPEHRKNILADPPNAYGSGCAARPERKGLYRLYCVQLFGARRP